MVRANRYALAAAQDGVALKARCARCTAVTWDCACGPTGMRWRWPPDLLWVRTCSRCMNATTRSLGGSSVLRRLRAVAHDAGDRNEQSGTMLSPNNGEITPTGN